MRSAATAVRDLIDTALAERITISKPELLREAADAGVGEDALVVIRELPEGEYTGAALHVRLEEAVREREQAREAGMDAHAEPGWRPPSVRRHPNA